MTTKIAKQSPLTALSKLQAEACVSELVKISEANDGAITPSEVVTAARPESSPLHPVFEWQDEVAAEKYREHQARQLIRSVYVVQESWQEKERATLPSRVWVNTTERRDEEADKYVPLAKVTKDQPIETARRSFIAELDELLTRFRAFPEITKLIDEMIERTITAADSKRAPVRELLAQFDRLHQKKFKVRAAINPGKDGALIAQLWQQRRDDPVTVEMLMEEFFKMSDPFVTKAGYTVGVFKSQVGKLIPKVQAAVPRQVMDEYVEELCARAGIDNYNTKSWFSGASLDGNVLKLSGELVKGYVERHYLARLSAAHGQELQLSA